MTNSDKAVYIEARLLILSITMPDNVPPSRLTQITAICDLLDHSFNDAFPRIPSATLGASLHEHPDSPTMEVYHVSRYFPKDRIAEVNEFWRRSTAIDHGYTLHCEAATAVLRSVTFVEGFGWMEDFRPLEEWGFEWPSTPAPVCEPMGSEPLFDVEDFFVLPCDHFYGQRTGDLHGEGEPVLVGVDHVNRALVICKKWHYRTRELHAVIEDRPVVFALEYPIYDSPPRILNFGHARETDFYSLVHTFPRECYKPLLIDRDGFELSVADLDIDKEN